MTFVSSLLSYGISLAAETPATALPKCTQVANNPVVTFTIKLAQQENNQKSAKSTAKDVTEKLQVVLYPKCAPKTVENFLNYVKSGFYNGTIFHRVIPGFMIQGGGFTLTTNNSSQPNASGSMKQKETLAPIKNEANNGLLNNRGTIAMARTNDPNSATAQFFINLKDNPFLNYSPSNPGYAVFGQVLAAKGEYKGMALVDAIAKLPTHNLGPYANVPVQPVIIESVALVNQPKAKQANNNHHLIEQVKSAAKADKAQEKSDKIP